jgi:hypothetical protein
MYNSGLIVPSHINPEKTMLMYYTHSNKLSKYPKLDCNYYIILVITNFISSNNINKILPNGFKILLKLLPKENVS